jgi:ABC-type transporter MlaC component
MFSSLGSAKAVDRPEDLIKDILTRASKENLLLNQNSKDVVDSYVDFSEMSKKILAGDVKKRSIEDLKWFESTIKEIITRTVYPEAPNFLKDVDFSFNKTEINDQNARITSTVKKKGDSVQIDYEFKKIRNEWKIVDVSIDDESWVKTINEKIKKTITEKGWKTLTEKLNKRLNELKKTKNNT